MTHDQQQITPDWLSPLDCAVYLVAPLKDLGAAAGVSAKAPYNWRSSSNLRDAGQIPIRSQVALLRHAQKRGIPLKAEHLILGASRDEIAELCRAIGKVPPPPATRVAAE